MSTIKELYKIYFKKISALELELLIAHALKKSREFILAHPEKTISNERLVIINKNIKRRIKGEPLAYILGEKEFYGLNFKVDKNVLIPRPETELMVEEALQHISHNTYHITHNKNQKTQNKMVIIDVGTGSGCVIIVLAKLLKRYTLHVTRYTFFAVDISKKALAIARQNAKLHYLNNIKFIKGDLLYPLLSNSKPACPAGRFQIPNSQIIFLANLPYLTPAQIKKSPTIKYEPKLALSAGKDGLKYYQKLLKQIRYIFDSLSFAPHSRIFAILEIDPSQKNKIISLIKKELPEAKAEIKKDLKGHSRLAVINLN